MMEWQPIETAPKGIEILGYERGVVQGIMWDDYEFVGLKNPTHWMPLPEPPK